MDEEHKDPEKIDLKAPRLAQYMQKAWKKHQNTVYWVDIKLAQKERIEVLSETIERHHSLQDTPSLLYPKVVRVESGEIITESARITSNASEDFLET